MSKQNEKVTVTYDILADEGRIVGEIVGTGKDEKAAENDAAEQFDQFRESLWLEAQ